jgi:hypothetical protein
MTQAVVTQDSSNGSMGAPVEAGSGVFAFNCYPSPWA